MLRRRLAGLALLCLSACGCTLTWPSSADAPRADAGADVASDRGPDARRD